MNKLIDREMFLCPICCEEYDSNDLIPISITCGHTFCRKCVIVLCKSNKLTCPIDKKVTLFLQNENHTKRFVTNKILEKLARLSLLTPINLRIFSGLEFKFCKDCKIFLSNFTFQIHQLAGHRLKRITEFDYNEKYFNENNLHVEFCLLYNFMNASRLLPFEIENQFNHYEENFSFVGQIWKENQEENIRNVLLLEDDIKFSHPLYVKGSFITKDRLIIKGFFLTQDKWKFRRAFGFLQDSRNEKYFFGVLQFDLQMNIRLVYGILVHDDKIFFGSYEREFLYPTFILKIGEKIDRQERLVIRKDESGKKFRENLTENIFFAIDQDLLSSGKWILIKRKKESIYYRLEYTHSENGFICKGRIKFVHQSKEIIDAFKIDPLIPNDNMLDLKLSNCYFTFNKYSIQFYFCNNSVIITNNFKYSQSFVGYQLDINKDYENKPLGNDESALKIIREFFSMRDVNVRDLFSFLDSFINNVFNFLELPCKYLKVSLWEFESYGNKRKIRDETKFTPNTSNGDKLSEVMNKYNEERRLSDLLEYIAEITNGQENEQKPSRKVNSTPNCRCDIF